MANNKENKLTMTKPIKLALSTLIPLVILITRPLGMDLKQSALIALIALVITWWCAALMNKIIASCVLLLGFVLLNVAPINVIFSFAISPTFYLIALTYIFSRGISNSKLAEKYLEPILSRYANTPLKTMLWTIVFFAITMYAIPQPLARLIIVAEIFNSFLNKTDADDSTKQTLMFNVFVTYVFINICTLRADIIFNSTAANVAGLTSFTDFDWIKYMALPTLVYIAIVIGLQMFLFRKELAGKKLNFKVSLNTKRDPEGKKKDIVIALLLLVTIVLWLLESFHGVAAWIVTLVAIGVMFGLKVLKLPDLKALDVTTLIFLVAAISIGGVMQSSGAADILFSSLRVFVPDNSIVATITVIIAITICMHMFLGSNTTTISVVVPGLILICADILPVPIIMCVTYITLATQWLFPFHSVALMIGVSKNYFAGSKMFKLGLLLTVVVFIVILAIYLPWWMLIGVV